MSSEFSLSCWHCDWDVFVRPKNEFEDGETEHCRNCGAPNIVVADEDDVYSKKCDLDAESWAVEAIQQAVATERERCAKAVEDSHTEGWKPIGWHAETLILMNDAAKRIREGK